MKKNSNPQATPMLPGKLYALNNHKSNDAKLAIATTMYIVMKASSLK